jgi:hypothetical protein
VVNRVGPKNPVALRKMRLPRSPRKVYKDP